MNNAINLLPCPMCGCNNINVKNEQPKDNCGGYFIECPDCGISTSLRYACGDDPIPLLAEQWNRRTTAHCLHQIAEPAATQPAAQGMDAQNLYYLQDARHHAMVGNCPSWWRPDSNGYTTNLDEAERFTFEEAMKQHKCRETDLPWLCSEVDKLRRPTVDCQYMPRSWDAQRAALAAQAKQGGA